MATAQQLRTSLSIRTHLTQQQIQTIKLLEIPALELEERILKEISENPALEYGEASEEAAEETSYEADTESNETEDSYNETEPDPEPTDSSETDDVFDDIQDYLADYDDREPDYAERQGIDRNLDSDRREPFMGVQTDTLQDYLMQQLADLSLGEEQRIMAEYLVGNIDEDGYLRTTLDAVADQIAFQQALDIQASDLQAILEQIQGFEPAGVAASDLRECLLLQLKRKPRNEDISLAIRLLEEGFEDFSAHRYQRIRNRLHLDENQLQAAIREITRLNPKPGNNWEASALNETGRAITPDFLVENQDGKAVLSLADTELPNLHVSNYYKKLLHNYQSMSKASRNSTIRDAAVFAKQKIDAANWFIGAIRQRQQTLMLTMQAIVARQEAFFLSGDDKTLRPMKLKDVADDTGLDISTISRVSNSKYVQTDYGMFPLKYFFSESMQTDSGEEVSVKEIKSCLKELIEAEPKSEPYTDDALVKLLQEKGYKIARRTVAKYREQLNFPTARKRRL